MANPTAQSIIDLARSLVREDSGSDVPAVSDTFLLAVLSEANRKYYDTFNTSGEEPIVFKREFGIDLVPETTVLMDATSIDTVLYCTTTANFPQVGSVITWTQAMPDVIAYTSNDNYQQLQNVTGISFNHYAGDEVQMIYPLPSDFGGFRESPGYGDGVMLNGIGLSYMGGFPTPGFFGLYDDGTTKYIIFARQSTGQASILYDRNTTAITAVGQTVDVPLDYQFFLIWHLVAYMYMGREDDAQKMQIAQKQSEMVLMRAVQNRNTRKVIRARSLGRLSKDYVLIGDNYIPLG